MLYLAIFLLLLILYITLFRIDIKAVLEYMRNEQDEWLIILFYTRKDFFCYRYEIPLVKKKGDKAKFKLVKGQSREMHSGEKKKGPLSPVDIYNQYIRFRIYLKDHAKLLEDIKAYLNKQNVHVELKIKLKEGTGDAAVTGLICGALWAAAGILISYISRFVKSFENDISITPSFDKKIFDVEATCIFHVKLVHIIVVLIKIYYTRYLLKMKSEK